MIRRMVEYVGIRREVRIKWDDEMEMNKAMGFWTREENRLISNLRSSRVGEWN